MDEKQRFVIILVLVMTLIISGCGPGQLLGPTMTPSPTSTPLPTSTPAATATPAATSTPTPVPVETVLLANGFTLIPEETCSDSNRSCKFYKNTDLLMSATFYDDGELMFARIPLTAEMNMQQGPIQIEIFNSLYTANVAEAALGQRDGGKLPYEGEIDGYEYSATVKSTGQTYLGEDVIMMVIIVKPID